MVAASDADDLAWNVWATISRVPALRTVFFAADTAGVVVFHANVGLNVIAPELAARPRLGALVTAFLRLNRGG